jgi:hypothetical protein
MRPLKKQMLAAKRSRSGPLERTDKGRRKNDRDHQRISTNTFKNTERVRQKMTAVVSENIEDPLAREDWDPSKGPEALLRNIGPMSKSDCVKPECCLLMHHKLTMLSEDCDN